MPPANDVAASIATISEPKVKPRYQLDPEDGFGMSRKTLVIELDNMTIQISLQVLKVYASTSVFLSRTGGYMHCLRPQAVFVFL
ncbi:hypothetical protein QQ045_012536 [Rhodiola kirilowii]